MERTKTKPLYQHIKLTDYVPLPRSLLGKDLSSTALVLYGVLLDRATLSQKNGYTDELGRVYVIYSIEKLSQTLHISDTAIKRHLRALEEYKLIRRIHPARNKPSHIYLNIPEGCVSAPSEEQNCTPAGTKMSCPAGRKVPTNNKRKQQECNNAYYQHGEGESL